jgi:hypothetical protein
MHVGVYIRRLPSAEYTLEAVSNLPAVIQECVAESCRVHRDYECDKEDSVRRTFVSSTHKIRRRAGCSQPQD